MIEKKTMQFKTVNWYSKGQISAVIIFTIGAIGVLYIAIFEEGQGNDLWAEIGLIAGTLYGLWVLLGVVRSWFTNVYTLKIDGKDLHGENLFGKPFHVNLDEAREFRRVKGYNNFEVIDHNNNKLKISADMDYYGYICDYIVNNISSSGKVDAENINKFRERTKYWSYTRRQPFSTKYPEGYLDWLEPIVEAQKEELIEKGILKRGVHYGENDRMRKLELELKKEKEERERKQENAQ